MWGSFWILWNLWMSTAYFENYWVNCETNNFSYLSILLENKILISGIQMSMDIIEKSCWICSSGSKFEKRVTLDFVIFITIFVRFQRNQRVIQVETRYISSTSPKALKCMLHTFIFVNGDIIFPKNGFDPSISPHVLFTTEKPFCRFHLATYALHWSIINVATWLNHAWIYGLLRVLAVTRRIKICTLNRDTFFSEKHGKKRANVPFRILMALFDQHTCDFQLSWVIDKVAFGVNFLHAGIVIL